jgi:hypothetical protein
MKKDLSLHVKYHVIPGAGFARLPLPPARWGRDWRALKAGGGSPAQKGRERGRHSPQGPLEPFQVAQPGT